MRDHFSVISLLTVTLGVQQFCVALKNVSTTKPYDIQDVSTTEDPGDYYYDDDYYSDDNSTTNSTDTEGRTMPSLPMPFTLSDNPDDVKFLLFQNASNVNSSRELILNDTKSVDRSGFKSKQKTTFLIHGFMSNSSSGMASTIKKAYLEAGVPQNIIVVDWGKLSTPDPDDEIFSRLSYPIIVSRNIPIAYKRVAEFIQFLVDRKYASLDRIHLVGHSLGAHVSGGAGNTLRNNPTNNGRRLARITGLDPAGPLFQAIRIQRRINGKDADFVDIYHTAAGTLGNVIRRLGDVDFFPNGGHHQPGCVDFTQPVFFEAEFGSCSHSFVSKIYAASITKNFTACQCDPLFVDYIAGSKCPGNCNVTVLAGEPCPPTASGQFYFETSEDPFKDDE